MPKRLTQKEVERLLTQHGFSLSRQTGSHRVFTNGSKTTVVPAHGKQLKIGTLCGIIRDSGLPKSLFL